jgi:cholecystokinin-like receptor
MNASFSFMLPGGPGFSDGMSERLRGTSSLTESNLTVGIGTGTGTSGGSSAEAGNPPILPFPGKSIIIPLYTLIFFLSFIGNLLVILTLARNRRMRTVTNVFLLNLVRDPCLLIMWRGGLRRSNAPSALLLE